MKKQISFIFFLIYLLPNFVFTQNIGFPAPIVGINELKKENLLVISPNPADDFVNLQYFGNDYPEKALILSDAFGRVIKTSPFYGISIDLQRENLLDGFYFFSVKNKEGLVLTSSSIVFLKK
jgi:hypothetical protein